MNKKLNDIDIRTSIMMSAYKGGGSSKPPADQKGSANRVKEVKRGRTVAGKQMLKDIETGVQQMY